MRLHEIGLDHAKTLTRTDWIDRNRGTQWDVRVTEWLTDHGFKKLGSGLYGTVWTDGSRAVVKIFRNDACYVDFANFCRRNRGNEHLPRITKVYPFRNGGVVFMEHLTKLHASYRNEVKRMHNYLAYCRYKYHDVMYAKYYSTENAEKFEDDCPSLAVVLRKIALECNVAGCSADLHAANVMMRGEVLVITDPFG